MKDFFDRIKTVAALDALPTPTYGVAFFGNPGVDHLDVGGRTAWAFHKDVGVGRNERQAFICPNGLRDFGGERQASCKIVNKNSNRVKLL